MHHEFLPSEQKHETLLCHSKTKDGNEMALMENIYVTETFAMGPFTKIHFPIMIIMYFPSMTNTMFINFWGQNPSSES